VVSPALDSGSVAASAGVRDVMYVGNNWDGTADIVDARTYRVVKRINTIPDKDQRLLEITTNPDKLANGLSSSSPSQSSSSER